jgi:hypothetical protein
MSRPPLPSRMNKPPPPHNLPREVPVGANNGNNIASVATSVTAGHENNGGNNNYNNWGNNENWNENEEYENWENDGTIAFSFGHGADVLIGKPAKERFNKVAAEIIAEHPEFHLAYVDGNPNAYGNTQPGYVIMVGSVPNGVLAEMEAQWPKFVEELEKRMPGVGVPASLRTIAPHLFVGQNQAGQGRRKTRARKRKHVKRKTSRRRRAKRRST